jgi:transcriptional regulator with XRE-family HTH domain
MMKAKVCNKILWLSVFWSMFAIANMLKLVMELREKLKLIRVHLGLTQDQMAEKLDIISKSRRSRISEWESGRREPKRDTLIKYADSSGINLRKLLDDREDIILQ